MLRLTFEDMDDPFRGVVFKNWGSQSKLSTTGEFVGQKPRLFQREVGDGAVTIHSGNLQGIKINWGSSEDMLGPPFTIGFWFRREVEESCTDIFHATGSVWSDYIRVYMVNNKIKFSILFPLKNLKFFKIKIINNDAIINVIKSPTIPVSVKISK